MGRSMGSLASCQRLGLPLVAICDFQRRAAPQLSWVDGVYNAIPVATFPVPGGQEALLSVSRPHEPGEGAGPGDPAAHAAGLPIVVAAKCTEPAERRYLEGKEVPSHSR